MTESGEDRTTARQYEPTPASAEDARQFLRDATARVQLDQDAVLLLGTELVTNAIRHARTPFVVEVRVRDDRVRIAVTDANTQIPVVRPLDLDTEGGLGMNIVNQMSDKWGACPTAEGKTVWFETGIG